MASVDSQNYSPIMEKRKFKDLLDNMEDDDDDALVKEDLITKIFSQTVQVSPDEPPLSSSASPEVIFAAAQPANDSADHRIADDMMGNLVEELAETKTTMTRAVNSLTDEDAAEHEKQLILEIDKVPTDLTHFNQTIVDLDDDEEEDCVLEGDVAEPTVDEELQEKTLSHTPSTISPTDEQSEIRDFEEIERITLLVEKSLREEEEQQKGTRGEESQGEEVMEDPQLAVPVYIADDPDVEQKEHLMENEPKPEAEQQVSLVTEDQIWNTDEREKQESPLLTSDLVKFECDPVSEEGHRAVNIEAHSTSSPKPAVEADNDHKERECTKETVTNDIATTEGQFQKEMSTTSSRKTVATTTKMVAASSSSTTTSLSVQQDATTVAENATIVKDEDKNVSVRKMKKVKKGKENISVVPIESTRGNPYSAATIGIFCSVRELSKLYEERQLLSRPRRPFIKEDIMQINLNVKNMCRSFLDLTQYAKQSSAPVEVGTTTAGVRTGSNNEQSHQSSSTRRSHNGLPQSDKSWFKRSKSVTDLSRYHDNRYNQHHQHRQHLPLHHHMRTGVTFNKKLLFFENWRRCVRAAFSDDKSGTEDDNSNTNSPCKQVHCPHCNSFSLRSEANTNNREGGGGDGSSLPPKIRISIMQFDMKSSFSKFDALQKKAAAAAAQPHANGSTLGGAGASLSHDQSSVRCTACEKVVYQMEQMKAENRYWHKNCFRCSTCNKPLSVDTYQSHEGLLYCKPHFKQLFSPKTVLDAEEDQTDRANRKGLEMIICESQPIELEGVVRATDKVEDGLTLDDLHRLKNVKQAFEMFEKQRDTDGKPIELSTHKVEKSPSIINKLATFQRKISRENNRNGRKKGVPAEDLNGEPRGSNLSDTSSCYSSEADNDDEEPPEGVDVDLWRARKATTKCEPIPHCADLDDLKKKFEGNNAEVERRERQEERREEIKRIRSRLFMGKQAKIKEQYQQAVIDSEFVPNAANNAETRKMANLKEKMQQLGECDEPAVNTTKQKLLEMKSENQMELEELRKQKQRDNLEIKSKFESGIEKSPSYRGGDDPELMAQMVDKGIARMSRNIFMEIDKQAAQQPGQRSPLMMQAPPSSLRRSASQLSTPQTPTDVVNKEGGEESEEAVLIDTKDLQKKFEFFEKYQEQDRSPKKTNINVSRFKDTSAVKEMFENNQMQDSQRRIADTTDETVVAVDTTKRMLNLFRDIESGAAANKFQGDGPRPLKAFTPPPDGGRRLYDNAGNGNNGEHEEDEDSDPGVTDNSDIEDEDEEVLKRRIGKYDDEILERAKHEARAQKLRAKFEKWETEQIRLEQEATAEQQQNVRKEYLDPTQLESATNLRQKFEFMSAKADLSQSNSPRKAVNRFV